MLRVASRNQWQAAVAGTLSGVQVGCRQLSALPWACVAWPAQQVSGAGPNG